MKKLGIVLSATESGAYLRASVEAVRSACAGCGIDAALVVVASVHDEGPVRETLSGIEGVGLHTTDTACLAALNNQGAAAASGAYVLFLREGVLLSATGLRMMLDTLGLDPRIAAVGPFTNRTVYSWQYLNAARMEADGAVPEEWLRAHVPEPAESLALENFALLMRRETFVQTGGFSEEFPAVGGEDIDLSFRLKRAGGVLLRVPAYFPHAGAEECDLYDMTRTTARPVLLARWGLDIGIPEKLWWDALEAIDWQQNDALIRATCRSALLTAPLVSIMIPTYNRPAYFRETLESARAQTYPNIEIIVCDNGTDDRTEELMRDYRDDPRIRYVRNRAARTKEENFMSFEHLAQGEYLQWCMDDDILLPDKLTLMADVLLRDPNVTLVTSARGGIDGGGTFLGICPNMPKLNGAYELFTGEAAGKMLLESCANFIGEPSAVLFRRQDLTHHYWRVEARGYFVISDCVMWLELLERGHCAIFSRPLSLYRMHAAQEGQRADVLVRSRIEWHRLVTEYWKRRMFITEAADYQRALIRMEEDCADTIEPLLSQLPPALRREYETGIAPLSVVVLNRIEECAPVRIDEPLGIMRESGQIVVSGCTKKGDENVAFSSINKLWNQILLIERRLFKDVAENCRLFTHVAAQGNLLLHEIDDHPDLLPDSSASNYFAFRAVSAVQTSTQPLADFLRAFNPHVLLFENQLAALPERRVYDRSDPHVTVFFGALNRQADWAPLMPALNAAIHTYGDRLSFLVTADRKFYDALQTRQKRYIGGERDGETVAPYERYTAALHASDIALLPLGDTVFNRAKSDLKFIESAGHGAAVLAAPTVYERTVRDGETGMIYRGARAFSEKLALLIERPDLRIRLAENAYRYVAENRLLAQHIEARVDAYRALFARREELERERSARVQKCFPHL